VKSIGKKRKKKLQKEKTDFEKEKSQAKKKSETVTVKKNTIKIVQLHHPNLSNPNQENEIIYFKLHPVKPHP
jgi:hypothetical protein